MLWNSIYPRIIDKNRRRIYRQKSKLPFVATIYICELLSIKLAYNNMNFFCNGYHFSLINILLLFTGTTL